MTASRISRLVDLADAAARTPEIDAIFFEASNTQVFASDEIKDRFRERWLGRYLDYDPGLTFVAVGPGDRIVGYLVGSLDDPALTPRFADIGYFAVLADLTACYPAHLHVNLDASVRGSGIGSDLVSAFVRAVAKAGIPGLHVVTSQGARNVAFYERLGFQERRAFPSHGANLVFLGRELASGRT